MGSNFRNFPWFEMNQYRKEMALRFDVSNNFIAG
jgi:hypothetical protein